MKPFLTTLLLAALPCFAQNTTPAQTRTASDGPFPPALIAPGGVILPLFPPSSPLLKRERIHEAELYNTAGNSKGAIINVINIHNPSIEVHLVGKDQPNTGTAVI